MNIRTTSEVRTFGRVDVWLFGRFDVRMLEFKVESKIESKNESKVESKLESEVKYREKTFI